MNLTLEKTPRKFSLKFHSSRINFDITNVGAEWEPRIWAAHQDQFSRSELAKIYFQKASGMLVHYEIVNFGAKMQII
jgi:hypothetical protein